MVKTKGADRTVEKWISRVGVAGPDYEAGVKNPKRDWATATKAAEATWKSAISDAIGRGAFGKGVSKAGTDKWQRGALNKGVARFPEGVRAAQDDYKAAMSEVLSVIEGVTLKARGPRGDPGNYERVKQIGDALHQWKLRRG